MTEQKELDSERKGLLLEEYRLLADFSHTADTVYWQRHSIYLAVSTGLLAALAVAGTKGAAALVPEATAQTPASIIIPVDLLTKGVCIAGALMSMAWLVAAWTGSHWCSVWEGLMRRVECEADLPTKMMQRSVPEPFTLPWLTLGLRGVRPWSAVMPLTFLFLWTYGFSWIAWHDGWYLTKAVVLPLMFLLVAVYVFSRLVWHDGCYLSKAAGRLLLALRRRAAGR